ncbi:MAG: tetratricopeptide repeat protein [Cyclobacteriaceae bacterium]|nr:tetratricopeptide repeat protein [Cyclobacteriaceae bacterium]
MKHYFLFIAAVGLFSCGGPKTADEQPATSPEAEAVSFLGTPLYAKAPDSLAAVKSDSLINAIRAKENLSEDDYVAIGRSLVGLGKFRSAVDVYTEGLAKFPDSYKLLRHRGHRFINLRQLDKAIVDLNRAEELIRNEPPVYEYDAAGKQGATYQHQIWYHIGLYHFLKRDYAKGAEAFENSLATAYSGGDKAGASDWLYNCYMRAGAKDQAAVVAKPFTLDFEIENKDYPYYRRLLLFNGVIKPAELVDENKAIGEMTLYEITKLYGLANYYAYQGDSTHAQTLYNKILQSSEWAGFAYASAELDARQ